MARLIFLSPYIKPGRAHAGERSFRVGYIATREGVQTELRQNRVGYMANRPGSHGLFNGDGPAPVLSQAQQEVADHPGIVWTPVISLHQQDAARLGYDDAANWQALIRASLCDIAHAYKIHPDHLRWYAAFHVKEGHPHVHMVIYSSDPKEGYLTRQGIRDLKSALAGRIFKQDLISIYQRQTEYRQQLGQEAASAMAELISAMKKDAGRDPRLEAMISNLAERLQATSGKKVYGYLPPATKALVDEIVDELAEDERVAAAYRLWQEMRNEVLRTYSDQLPEPLPLSRQKEFKSVRNMVIREALKLKEPEQKQEHQSASSSSQQARFAHASPTAHATASVHHAPTPASPASAVARMFHHMGRIFREQSARGNAFRGMRLDRKRWQELREKKLAQGQKM